MNRYPVWKYAIILVALVVGVLYTLPNFFGEVPAVQVSSGKSTVKVDRATRLKVDQALAQAKVDGVVSQDETSIRIQVESPEEQLKAKEALNAALNAGDPQDPDYVVALNLVPRTPAALAAIMARPMALGLDLRGGVHLMLQVDMDAAIVKRADSLAADVRTTLRDKNVRHGGVSRNGRSIEVRVRDAQTATAARTAIAEQFQELDVTQVADGQDIKIVGAFKPQALREVQDRALKQNITTLHNRVNQLGVSEPVIQQQGVDRIVVQLPGLQDAARAKDILGRTAVLEVRAVNMSAAAASGEVPFGSERFYERRRDGTMTPVVVQRQVILTGDRIVDASSTFDDKQRPAVSVRLDQVGGRIMRDFTRDNVGKLMAMILFEKKKGEAISVATIQSEFGSSFQITGAFSVEETNNLALLLRAGALAAPMEIVEEMTIGPTLGAENIAKGFHSVAWGFAAICAFMVVYYMLFGLFSGLALAVNLLLLVAILSMLQATLTLPGMAAMALALGMAIDSNVLINERVREELRNGASPQAAIHAGYDRAWATILDSNVTTLIAGLALLAFGSGPVRGFAVVHCIGILTSMFSAVFFSRGLVNFWYGRKKKLKSVSIGTVWRPAAADAITKPE
jgi:preprotein translocase subunit SecD